MGTSVKTCDAEGTSYLLTPCATDFCLNGTCLVCAPGKTECLDELTPGQCDVDGSQVKPLQKCGVDGAKEVCHLGDCVPVCATSLKEKSNVGCEYWAADLDNYFRIDASGEIHDAENAPYAIVVANVHDSLIAEVAVFTNEEVVAADSVAPGKLAVFPLVPRNVDGPLLEPLAYRITSDVPLVAYQFNPLLNSPVFSNDASLLIPSGSLGNDYYVMSWEQGSEYNRGFVTVIATTSGKTTVKVTPSCTTLASPDLPGCTKGQACDFQLNQFDVLNLETAVGGDDLTGTHIESSKPIAVFAGNECGNVPSHGVCVEETCLDGGFPCSVDVECPAICCCDHLEQQLLPVDSLGTHYLAARTSPRNGEGEYWRIMAAEEDVVVTLTPEIYDVPKLNAGAYVDFETNQSFEISASGKIMVGQFLAGQNAPLPNVEECVGASLVGDGKEGHCATSGNPCFYHSDCPVYCYFEQECESLDQHLDAGIGDPTFILQVPVNSFRSDYTFLVPDTYASDNLIVVYPEGAWLSFDGGKANEYAGSALGSGEYRVLRTAISDGTHRLRSNMPFGVIVYGFDNYVSYGYPAGMAIELLSSRR